MKKLVSLSLFILIGFGLTGCAYPKKIWESQDSQGFKTYYFQSEDSIHYSDKKHYVFFTQLTSTSNDRANNQIRFDIASQRKLVVDHTISGFQGYITYLTLVIDGIKYTPKWCGDQRKWGGVYNQSFGFLERYFTTCTFSSDILNKIQYAKSINYDMKLSYQVTYQKSAGVGTVQYCRRMARDNYEYQQCISEYFGPKITKSYTKDLIFELPSETKDKLREYTICLENKSCK